MITTATEGTLPKRLSDRTERFKKKKKKRGASDPVLLDTWGPRVVKFWKETGEVLHSLTSDIDSVRS